VSETATFGGSIFRFPKLFESQTTDRTIRKTAAEAEEEVLMMLKQTNHLQLVSFVNRLPFPE
jgi:hypothetical protein